MPFNKPVPFSLADADDGQISAWYSLNRHCRREMLPEDPDISLPSLLSRSKALDEIQSHREWAVWDSDSRTMLGLGRIHASKLGFSKGSAVFSITVRQDFRRRGLGRSFLGPIAETATGNGWKVLNSYSSSRCQAGSEFLKGIGAENISDGYLNRLVLSEVNHDITRKWARYPDESSIRIEIGEWAGLIPEERIEEVVDFYQAVYNAEDSNRDSEMKFTAEIIRKGEKTFFTGDRKRLMVIATDTRSGKLLGLTEITWSPSEPSILSQGYTAVLPEARGMGIGRRLKAEMLFRIFTGIKGAESIRAGNDAENAPIQKINQQLGFRHFITNHRWRMETDSLVKLTAAR